MVSIVLAQASEGACEITGIMNLGKFHPNVGAGVFSILAATTAAPKSQELPAQPTPLECLLGAVVVHKVGMGWQACMQLDLHVNHVAPRAIVLRRACDF